MLSKAKENSTSQMQIVSVDQLVPEDHLLRKIDAAIRFQTAIENTKAINTSVRIVRIFRNAQQAKVIKK